MIIIASSRFFALPSSSSQSQISSASRSFTTNSTTPTTPVLSRYLILDLLMTRLLVHVFVSALLSFYYQEAVTYLLHIIHFATYYYSF